MPVVTVWGIQRGAGFVDLGELALVIKEATASVPALKILPGNVTVFFPEDQLEEGLGEEVIIFIEGLFQRELRTAEVRQNIADAVGSAVWEYLHSRLGMCQFVEVIPRSQRPDDGYAKYPKDEVLIQSTDPTSAS